MPLHHNDEATLKALLGDDFRDLIPPVGAEVRKPLPDGLGQVACAPAEATANMPTSPSATTAGRCPIPLVKSATGWHFDTRAGAEEMRMRRIGRNELAVIQTMLAIYDAQREYAATDHDGEWRARLRGKADRVRPASSDGLYWPTQAG